MMTSLGKPKEFGISYEVARDRMTNSEVRIQPNFTNTAKCKHYLNFVDLCKVSSRPTG
jgi:hypothetical protein